MSNISRYDFITMGSAGAVAFALAPSHALSNKKNRETNMYGLIGKITAKEGRRDDLIEILLEGAADMPGCLSYIVSKDTGDKNGIWVTEVWDSKESHQNSLKLPWVKKAMNQGRPLIEEFSDRNETEPVGGYGLATREAG